MKLKIENLSMKFDKKEVLKNINFEINDKEIVAIIGASGSGKSTLLRCINMIEKPTTGTIYFDKYNNNMYIYDYETEELLYRNKNKELCSLDDKYKYTLNNDKYSNKKYKHMNKKHIQNKMQQETTILTKEDIKTLRRTKTLRH